MKKTISKSNFAQEFENYGRGDQFSREALDAIFDYLEDVDPDLELDEDNQFFWRIERTPPRALLNAEPTPH